MNSGEPIEVFVNEPIAGVTTVYSDPIDICTRADTYGVWLQATSATGDPKITVTYEQSIDLETSHFAAPKGKVAICSSRIVQTILIDDIFPCAMRAIRIKVVGETSNAADTLLTFKLYIIRKK